MTKGIKAYDGKQQKRVRRKNHIALDLASTKYRQRTKEGKKPFIDDHDWEDEVNEYYGSKKKQ